MLLKFSMILGTKDMGMNNSKTMKIKTKEGEIEQVSKTESMLTANEHVNRGNEKKNKTIATPKRY